jgi:hypothetical protein
MSIMNAMAFFSKDTSEVKTGNRWLSWFSVNDPSNVVSLQPELDFIVLIPLTRPLMLPLVDENAFLI